MVACIQVEAAGTGFWGPARGSRSHSTEWDHGDMPQLPADKLTEKIGVLTRREAEARVLAPLIAALSNEFGRSRVEAILARTIRSLAVDQGQSLSRQYGDSVEAFLETLRFWTQDDALEIETLAQTDTRLDFNVTRCRYAELYKALGIADLGAILSCNRDFSLIEGFNPKASLERKQTIMAGAPCCTFRYRFPQPEPETGVDAADCEAETRCS